MPLPLVWLSVKMEISVKFHILESLSLDGPARATSKLAFTLAMQLVSSYDRNEACPSWLQLLTIFAVVVQ